MSDPLQRAGGPTRVEGDIEFAGGVANQILPKQFVGRITKSSTLPSVKNCEHFVAQNTVPVTITDFKDGQEGQSLFLLGDGFTTLQHGTKIFTQAGSDLLLAAAKAYLFKRLSGAWYQI